MFTATDPAGLSGFDTVSLNVISLTDPPVPAQLPVVTMRENDTLSMPFSTWHKYLNHSDNPDTARPLRVVGQHFISVVYAESGVRLVPMKSWTGAETLYVMVGDRGRLSAPSALVVHVESLKVMPQIISVSQSRETLPTSFALRQNYPNPFNPTTTITFELPVSGTVSLRMFDMVGREVATLVNQTFPAGYHTVVLNSSTLASGLYLYHFQVGAYSDIKKMIILK